MTAEHFVTEFSKELPPNFPPLNKFMELCDAAGFSQNGVCFQVDGIPRFWVKIVNADPACAVRVPEVYLVFLRDRRRHIVMQYVEGDTVESRRQTSKGKYTKADVEAVAAAVRQLISLRMPSEDTQPGYIGGGFIGHDFFLECRATSEYRTYKDLEAQINKLVSARGLRVDFSTEVTEGLILCLSDIDPSNFIIDDKGQVFAIDFGHIGYMPSSYFSYSLQHPTRFTRLIALELKYPLSPNVRVMQIASGMIVVTGNNNLGIKKPR